MPATGRGHSVAREHLNVASWKRGEADANNHRAPASLVSICQIAMERNIRDSHLKGQAWGKAMKEEENSISWQEMQRQ